MKQQQNKRRKILTFVTCTMLAVMAVAGTLAYFSSIDTVANHFIAGKVQIDLVEPHYPGNSSDEVKNLVPNHEVQKDPKIVNTGENDAVVFIRVEVPKKAVKVVKNDGSVQYDGTEPVELFQLYKNEAVVNSAELIGDNWILVKKQEESDRNIYTYGYKKILKPEQGNIWDGVTGDSTASDSPDSVTETIFDKVRLVNLTKKPDENLHVKVTAYGIQAYELLDDNGTKIDDVDALDKAALEKIYTIYFTANN